MTAHVDILHQPIEVGDYVARGDAFSMTLGKIIAVTPKMVRYVKLDAKTDKALKGVLLYSKDMVKVDPDLVTFAMLANVK